MKRPVKKFNLSLYPKGDVTQWFGENKERYAHLGLDGHNGIDIVRPHGEVMYAIESGEIVSVKDDPAGYGKHLRLISDVKGEDGFYNEWTYGHNSQNLVKQGDKVIAGQPIALMGNTGFVVSGPTPFWKHNPYAGTHLHLGLRKVKKVKRGGWAYPGSTMKIEVNDYGNGFKGAVDPTEELLFAEDTVDSDVKKNMQLTVISLLKTVINLMKKQ